jgi:histone H3/H4
MESTQKAITKKKKTRFFETYISKVLKQVSADNGITANAKQQLNSAICLISREVSRHVITLTEIAKKKTMSEKEVTNALRIVLPEGLADSAAAEGRKAIDKFEEVDKVKGTSRQEKAGITFPPAQTEKFLRNFGYSKVMVTSHAPVFLAGALEYLTGEILESASVSAKQNKRVRITIRDLEIGIRTCEDLNRLFIQNKISLMGGGVIPFIHSSLMTKKARKKRPRKSVTEDGKKKHRFRPGTVSLREIRKFQKTSNCLTFAKFPFEKFVRDVVAEHNKEASTMKISKDVFIILQYFVEQKIVEILRNANFAAVHAGRVKLMPIDIDFVCAVVDGVVNPYQKSKDISNEPDIVEDEDVEEEDEADSDVEDELVSEQ